MTYLTLTTDRLELVAGTPELARADIESPLEFSKLLNAVVPNDWPPPLNNDDSKAWFARYLNEHPDSVGWVTWYYILRDGPDKKRVAIGNGGFKGKPTEDGTVEVGYSIIEAFQRNGYATEAAGGLVAWAFDHANVTRVIAETYPTLTQSIRVLEKIGFAFLGEGSEEGVIQYEISRSAFEAS